MRLVMDSKAITVKPSRDLYSAVSFTDQRVYSRDQTSLMGTSHSSTGILWLTEDIMLI